jgi:hypothetical protein
MAPSFLGPAQHICLDLKVLAKLVSRGESRASCCRPNAPFQPGARVAFDEAFTFLFRRPRGVTELLTGGLLLLIFWLVIPALIVVGYGVALGRAVAARDPDLPRFSIGQVADGFKAMVVMSLYSLPISIMYFAAVLPAFLAAGGREEFATPFFTVNFFAMIWAMIIYGLALAFVQPALFAVYIAAGTVSSCFSLRRLRSVISHWGGSYVAAAAIIFATSQLAWIGIVLVFIGIAFTAFYHLAFMAHISGQLARPLMARSTAIQ